MTIYRKYQKFIESRLFPVILLLYPFLTVNQGLDVADSTYSLTNFQYFDFMNGTWMVATFLSNVAGWLLMHLPFGETLLGMKCYTTLVQAVTALMVYFGLKKRIAAPLLFLGEFLALGLCWCPSTILYNYLTYFLMTAAVLLLYRGLTSGRAAETASVDRLCVRADECKVRGDRKETYDKSRRLCFVAAGICLGANVAVRMPNVVQAAFILAVWYGTVLFDRQRGGQADAADAGDTLADAGGVGDQKVRRAGVGKQPLPWGEIFTSTGWCLLGYAAGFGALFAAICIRYGVSAYPDMVRTMFAMTEQAKDYKPSSMLTGMFGDYIKGLYWLAYAIVCASVAGFAFWVRERLYGGRERVGQQDRERESVDIRTGRRPGDACGAWDAYRITGVIIKAAYILLLVVLLRFYWGRGMFHFRYYEYGNGSIYYPAILLLLVSIAAAGVCLIGKKVCAEQKLMAAFVLLQIFLTPLGSNNNLYPIINNLFVAAPFLLWRVWERFSRRREESGAAAEQRSGQQGNADDRAVGRPKNNMRYDFVWRAPFVALVIFVTVQSIGSHAGFAFQDGIYGEPRDMRVKTPEKAAGIYTNMENGALLEELAVFIEEEGLAGREMIAYGELPGLHYLLDMQPALSTAWPDLDSYRMAEYTRDMEALETARKAGEEPPVIIVSSGIAAYWSDDGEAINWFGVDMEKMAGDEKLRILWDFVSDHGYVERFGNARYVVYLK